MGSRFITVHYNWGNELHKGGDFLQDLEFKHASIQLLKCESKCVWPKARDFRNGPASSVWEESRQGSRSAACQCESVTSSAWHLLWSRSVHKFLPWSQGNTKESSPTGDLHGTGRTKCKGRKFEQVSFLGCHLMCRKNYIFLFMLKKRTLSLELTEQQRWPSPRRTREALIGWHFGNLLHWHLVLPLLGASLSGAGVLYTYFNFFLVYIVS